MFNIKPISNGELAAWLTWAIKQIVDGQTDSITKLGWTVYRDARGGIRVSYRQSKKENI